MLLRLLFLISAIALCNLALCQIEVATDGKVGVGTIPSGTMSQLLNVYGNSYISGNLGVGITSASQKLHVSGNGYFTGNLGINVASPLYKLDVAGSVRLNSSTSPTSIGNSLIYNNVTFSTITGTSLYPSNNLGVYLGTTVSRFKNLYVYMVDYVVPCQVSDVQIKENILPCPPLLDKVRRIQPYNYNYTDDFLKDFSEEEKEYYKRTEFGFIAQEIQEIFPELVYVRDSSGMLSMNYIGMIPILTSAIKELQQEVEVLRKELLEYRENGVVSIKNMEQESSNIQFVLSDLEDKEEMKVYQNAPNPFNENTTIKSYIPKSVNKAQLCVYDMQGVQVKCLEIAERETVDVHILAGQLYSGIYTYLLIGDGKTSEAKMMVLTK